eukprot:g52697.t1
MYKVPRVAQAFLVGQDAEYEKTHEAQEEKRVRCAVGFDAGFLSLVDIQDGRGFYVAVVPKISKRMARLCHWIRCPRTVIMAYGGEYVKSDSVCPEEQKEGGGFAQHSLRPNCEAAIENDGARVLIRSIENIFFGQCITIHYGKECLQWMRNI